MKVFLTILFWTLITFYLVVALGFTAESRKGIICTEVSVIIEDSLSRRFYSKKDIEKVINKGGLSTVGYPLAGINTRKLEALFQSEPYIRRVDVYATKSGKLVVRVNQRDPVIRIITADGKCCYLDSEGYVMPENRKYAQFVMVANGHFPGYSQVIKARNLNNLEEKEKFSEWFDVLKLALKLNSDDFWRSQIIQVYLNRQGNFEMYPRVGAHQIILGSLEDLDDKLEKLTILYEKGLAYEGWNNYEKIDLRYKNQVVCTKR